MGGGAPHLGSGHGIFLPLIWVCKIRDRWVLPALWEHLGCLGENASWRCLCHHHGGGGYHRCPGGGSNTSSLLSAWGVAEGGSAPGPGRKARGGGGAGVGLKAGLHFPGACSATGGRPGVHLGREAGPYACHTVRRVTSLGYLVLEPTACYQEYHAGPLLHPRKV